MTEVSCIFPSSSLCILGDFLTLLFLFYPETYAYDDIPAGMELFVDYGESYFTSRENIYGPIPNMEDYEHGDHILAHMSELIDEIEYHENVVEHVGDNVCKEEGYCVANRDLWRWEIESDLLQLLHDLGTTWKSRPLLTLPENATHVDYLLEYGTQFLHYNRSVRSLEWLRENGICTDNIRPGNSTIPQAGRGGFATRNIPKGEVVAPVPLIHIPNRSIYNMYEVMVDTTYAQHSVVRNVSAIVGHQLLLNYCFGHRQSTLLLCPYGVGMGLINHSKEKQNTKLVWSTKGTRHPEWREQRVDEWATSHHAGLAFELIALRDIERDEEIFISYGEEWEQAFKKHVENWKPPPGGDQYYPSPVLNEMDDAVIRTVAEGSYNPENDKILYCREIYRQYAGWNEESPYDFQNCRALERFVGPDGEFRYIVQTYAEVEGKTQCFEKDRFIIFDMPRDGFNFRDALYALDHSQRWAFRHDIRIPDELMPEAWKNLP